MFNTRLKWKFSQAWKWDIVLRTVPIKYFYF